MQRLKLHLSILVLFSSILFPSGCVLASNGNLSTVTFQTTKASHDTLVSPKENSQSYPETLPPSNILETNSPNISASGTHVYLPTVVSNPAGSISVPSSVSGTYYVSLTGSDSNPGSQARPWRTLQKAADTLVAGDTVKILPGTYVAKFTPKNSGKAGALITYTADPGTVILDGSGVTMSGDANGDGLVQIQGKSYIKVQNLTLRNASVNCVNISPNTSGTRPTYIEISSLTLQNCNKVGIRVRSTDHLLLKDNSINHVNYSSGIGVWWSSDVTVDHNFITNAHFYHECQGAYDEALTISYTNRFEVKNNTLDNTEANPSGFCSGSEKLGIDVKESSQNGLVHHNTVRHMNAAGIYVDAWHAGGSGTPTLNHIDIYQNLVSDGGGIIVGAEQPDGVVEYINIYNNLILNSLFSAIQVRGAYGDGLRKNITIYNNTIYGALPAGGNGGAGIYVTTSNLASNNSDAPVIIRNNVSMFYFLSNGGGAVGQIRAGNSTIAAKIAADHNLVYGPQQCSSEYPSCVEVGSRVSAAPASVFSNPGALDLHLKSGSPAINVGLTISLITTDFDGFTRPQPYDIGAYEFK